MHISEMRRREDFDAILAETLTRAWSLREGHPVTVRSAEGAPEGQHWRFLPVHSAFVLRSPGPRVRRFLADSIRYTSRRGRRRLQWIAGTLLSTPVGLALSQRSGFVVNPPIADAEELIVLPGNQRIRLFNLRSQRTWVYAKEGFSNALMVRELALRTSSQGAPYPPILAHDPEGRWFEEPLLAGWNLARCPTSIEPTQAVMDALQALERWSIGTAQIVSASEHVDALATRIRAGLVTLSERFGYDPQPWGAWLTSLVEHASEGDVHVGTTHGDVQPGNIIVHPGGSEATLIDWEHCRERMLPYDRMVIVLEARYQRDLAARLRAFVGGQSLPWWREQPELRADRRTLAARFLLEDITFQVDEAAAGPYREITAGLRAREVVLSELGPSLGDLWSA
jgi:hypothetical protein